MAHLVDMRYSDDGAHNWTSWKPREAGRVGRFLGLPPWRRLGRALEERIWEIRDTSTVSASILSASILAAGEWQPFALPDGTYSDATRPWTRQDVCNYLPTFAEASGTRSPIKYMPVPGLELALTVGTGPHRGGRDVEGVRFVVSGTKLYKLSAQGVATELGTIPGTGLVSITHNQVAGGNQVVIGTGDNSYVYDTSDSTFTANGVGLQSVDFLGQYILGIEPQRRFWRISALVDAKSYSDLDVYSAESSPDRIVGLIASQNEVLVFGERTIEPWTNSPTDTVAFKLSPGAVAERGCINANTIKRLDNSVFFVDNNYIPCRMQGYTPVPIAPKAIVDELSQCDPAKLFAYTWEDKGYVVYYITGQDGRTWGYDVTSQRWHRRESFGLDRWRLNTLFKWNGDWYGGDYSSGNLYKLVWSYAFEACEVMPRSIRTGVLHNNGNPISIDGFKLLMDSGGPESACAPVISYTIDTLPDTCDDSDYSEALNITEGLAPYSNARIIGTAPTGTTLTIDGSDITIAFSDATAAVYTFGVTVDDANGRTSPVFTVRIVVRHLAITGNMANGYVGDEVSTQYTATGGVAPITYAISAGALPAGVTLDTGTGLATGTRTTANSDSWTVHATDANGCTAILAGASETTIRTAPTIDAFYIGGIRKVVDGYVGPAIRVIRLSDSTESDIGFATGSRELDVAALETFGAGTNCEVVKIYRQAGSSTDLSLFRYSDAAFRPQIVVAGVYLGYIKNRPGGHLFVNIDSTPPLPSPLTAITCCMKVGIPAVGSGGRYVFMGSDNSVTYSAPNKMSAGWISTDLTHFAVTHYDPANSADIDHSKYLADSFADGTLLTMKWDVSLTGAGRMAAFVNGTEPAKTTVSVATVADLGGTAYVELGGGGATSDYSTCELHLESFAIYYRALDSADRAEAEAAL